jgi:GMP synthase-like glutamine amidotransferase
MGPIAVFRFSPTEGPAHFAEWLDAQRLPWQLVAIDRGDAVPDDPRAFAGIGMMGGPMSVNDALPWIAPLNAFVRRAVDARVPVIGHCLGGQLLAQSLGATVRRTATPEIGWIDVDVSDAARGPEWFGDRARFTAFQWHYDVFDLPAGAVPVLHNAFNPNQGYVIDDRHIGFQCHIEMTRELVETWCRTGAAELPERSDGPLQSRDDILRHADARLRELNAVADGIYARWATRLAH